MGTDVIIRKSHKMVLKDVQIDPKVSNYKLLILLTPRFVNVTVKHAFPYVCDVLPIDSTHKVDVGSDLYLELLKCLSQ